MKLRVLEDFVKENRMFCLTINYFFMAGLHEQTIKQGCDRHR